MCSPRTSIMGRIPQSDLYEDINAYPLVSTTFYCLPTGQHYVLLSTHWSALRSIVSSLFVDDDDDEVNDDDSDDNDDADAGCCRLVKFPE